MFPFLCSNDVASERCPSGLRSATGNRVCAERCVEGSNPSLSARSGRIPYRRSGFGLLTHAAQGWLNTSDSHAAGAVVTARINAVRILIAGTVTSLFPELSFGEVGAWAYVRAGAGVAAAPSLATMTFSFTLLITPLRSGPPRT